LGRCTNDIGLPDIRRVTTGTLSELIIQNNLAY
jgi:hypothetical protein